MPVRKVPTLDQILQKAKQFNRRKDFATQANREYVAAQKLGILDLACSHMKVLLRKWTHEALALEAKKYQTPKEFERSDAGAYYCARNRGILREICGHMANRTDGWTEDELRSEAIKYQSRKDFERGSSAAYQFANRRGMMDEICSHMTDSGECDNDAIYIWRHAGAFFNGCKVYKIGVTSNRLGDYRIKTVASKRKLKAELVILQKTKCKATYIEEQLLMLGFDPKYEKGDGATEFRALDDDELEYAIQVIKEYSC